LEAGTVTVPDFADFADFDFPTGALPQGPETLD
jgi:hypothetical protein